MVTQPCLVPGIWLVIHLDWLEIMKGQRGKMLLNLFLFGWIERGWMRMRIALCAQIPSGFDADRLSYLHSEPQVYRRCRSFYQCFAFLQLMTNTNLKQCYIIMLVYATLNQSIMWAEMVNSRVWMQNTKEWPQSLCNFASWDLKMKKVCNVA